MAYIIENLPRAGIPMLYQFGTGKWHKAVIDSGIVMTYCGIHKQFPNLNRPYYMRFANPNKDSFSISMYFDHTPSGQNRFCQKCAR